MLPTGVLAGFALVIFAIMSPLDPRLFHAGTLRNEPD
jgi:hypothetical protein